MGTSVASSSVSTGSGAGTASTGAQGTTVSSAANSFDFDTPQDRSDIFSLKWDVEPGELPMWVADMDIATAPCIRVALAKRLENGTFGYSVVPDEYRRSVADWWQRRHGVVWELTDVVFSTGVVPSISSLVRSLTNVAEYVVVQPPVYNIFYNSIVNNGRRVLENPLIYDEQACSYRMDFDDLDRKLAHPQATLMILCNPHNPTGNVWSREDLAHVGELCARHGVTVVSDEIHCEVTRPDRVHVPFAAASDTCRDVSVTCASPSKAFNVAGLQSSYMLVSNPRLRARAERGLNTDECAEPNAFAIAATIAAYNEGEEWLDALRAYLWGNRAQLALAVESGLLPGVRLTPADATYLAWLDCGLAMEHAGLDDSAQLVEHIRRTSGLILSAGSAYGQAGKRFLRVNLGTCASRVADGLERLARSLKALA